MAIAVARLGELLLAQSAREGHVVLVNPDVVAEVAQLREAQRT